MLFSFISVLFMLVGALLSVAFFTLTERKMLSLSQTRLGPNKVSVGGILQPVLDGLKLLTKEFISPSGVSSLVVQGAPAVFFILMIMFWSIVPSSFSLTSHMLGGMLLMALLGMSVYCSLMTGVMSHSKFGVLGGMRGAAQSIGYEVGLSLVIYSALRASGSWGMSPTSVNGPMLLLLPLILVCVIAEVNRAPLDFAEGESELISGFNIEYGGGPFTLLFLGEYGMILSLSMILAGLCVPPYFGLVVFFFILVIRSTLPRFRYDMLMGGCWFFVVPWGCIALILSSGL